MQYFKRVSVGEARDVLNHLDLLMLYHDDWVSNFMRAIICHERLGDEYIAVDSYDTCRFGRWLVNDMGESLRDVPIVSDIRLIHKNMHLAYRNIFLRWEKQKEISTADFDEANTKKTAFKLSVSTMQFMIYDYLFQVDPLTKTLNRTKLLSTLERERNRIAETKESCSIVMVDIDHFKVINDTYGHAAGDMVLVQTSLFLSSSLRPMDVIFRYGGEEFLMYLPNVAKTEALSILERVRENLAKNNVMIETGQNIKVTASFGVSALDPFVEISMSVDKADRALYIAKNNGRNQVVWVD